MVLDPHNLLDHVHPDLVRVLTEAPQYPQAFQVVYGIRTMAEEAQAVATGHSETMHSRHLPDPAYGGVAMAVDVAAVVSGAISWTVEGPDGGTYGQVAEQVLATASALGIKVQWGGSPIGAWVDGQTSTFRDWGHFQLDPSAYP